MKKILIILMVLVLAGCSATGNKLENTGVETRSPELVNTAFHELLLAGDYQALETDFVYSKDMIKFLEKTSMEDLFVELKTGKAVSQESSIRTEQGEFVVFSTPTVFEQASYNFNLVFNEDNQIAGVNVAPYAPATESTSTVDPTTFVEIDTPLTGNGDPLPGLLTLPAGDGTYPVVILVHGSGASDKDETILENKPFRDLAHGLAAKGIGSYRYDKRSFVYPEALMADQDLTLMEETVHDAVAASKLVAGLEGVSPDQVYVLGHSLGGHAIPLIAEASSAKGYIIMAGNVRPLEDLITEQVTYLVNLDGQVTAEEQTHLDQTLVEVDKIKALDQLKDGETAMGLWPAYWAFLEAYDPLKQAEAIGEKVLVLQGERDYQVTLEDFALWQDTFTGAGNWTFKSYPKLNHLMMPGEGVPSNMDYFQKNTVSDQVIEDIADWIME